MQDSHHGPKATDTAEISQGDTVIGNADGGVNGSDDPEADVDGLEEFDLDDIEIIESKVFG